MYHVARYRGARNGGELVKSGHVHTAILGALVERAAIGNAAVTTVSAEIEDLLGRHPGARRVLELRERRRSLELELGHVCAFLAANAEGGAEGAKEVLGFWYEAAPEPIDLVAHLQTQRDFSLRTFGPGERTAAVLDHIRKELVEVEMEPRELGEWIDVVLLAFDGAMRAGHDPAVVAAALLERQRRNMSRAWPDWRTADPDKAIEHVRDRAEGGSA